ncbi:FMN-binding negative transcriptional regulator [Kitasatospora sp. NPDC087861]|uniref:FMN-binding negative transcriptional regulator n=1 Tax=Kitasatospora sp. NPDC087861 TaxID=3364070 RepID=UPI00380201E5
MFVPECYREPDGSWMAELVRRNPLAQLVTNGPAADGPRVTHLPVIRDPAMTGDWPPDLSGGLLVGHMNRANPHWAALESGTTALLTFTGPHAYVSPTLYGVTPASPTWNFTAVHVRGVLRKIATIEETLEVVKATVRAFERDFGSELGVEWDMTGSLDYFRSIVPAVGAFRFEVTGADGMFKLSQEKEPEIRDRVRQCFAQRDSGRHREAAALMGRLMQTSPAGDVSGN